MTYTVQNLAAQFASLSMKAEAGDLMASRTLFEGLENCDSAPRTPKRLQQMRDITAASFARNPPPPGDCTLGDPVASDAMIISRFERCGGVTDEHLAERAKFGQQLADSGDEFARLQYQEWAMPTA